jgi:hypothetical protein
MTRRIPARELEPGAMIDAREAHQVPGPPIAHVTYSMTYGGQTWLRDLAGTWHLFDDGQMVPAYSTAY